MLSSHQDNVSNDHQDAKEMKGARYDSMKIEMRTIVSKVVDLQTRGRYEELPGLLTGYIDTLLSMNGYDSMQLFQELIDEGDTNGEVSNAVEYILGFVEEFVEQAITMNNHYKEVLGKIIKIITPSKNNNLLNGEEASDIISSSDQEVLLDEFFTEERESFTPGFLRHIEGECQRIASAPEQTPEATKMLEALRMIQIRIIEELGEKDIGEGAVVLGQLLGYEDSSERLAVLDAGLCVRGVDFAKELKGLTEEALDGFKKVPFSEVDPNLIAIVTEIDDRILSYISTNSR